MDSRQPGDTSTTPASTFHIPSPPSLPFRPLRVTTTNSGVMSHEMIEALDYGQFLHVLATDPGKVIPPGKSLASAFLRLNSEPLPSIKGGPSTIEKQVENMVHRAFWDEVLLFQLQCRLYLRQFPGKALQSLSDPAPSVQLTRLQGLYQDLHIALKSLLTPQHPVLTTFSSPLSPTPSPLRSAVTHLREALRSLRQKCAPVRDGLIDGLLSKLEDPPTTQLPSVVVDVVRSMLELADIMKGDLTEVVLGSVGEEQLEAVVRCNARDEEKTLVLKFWGLSRAKNVWIRWIYDYEPPPSAPSQSQSLRRLWVSRLLTALTTNVPVIVEIPIDPVVPSSKDGTEPNPLSELPPSPKPSAAILPPFLMMVSSTLWYLQNSIQMVVILACLRSLVRLPNTATSNAPEYDFINRVWTILQSVLGDRGPSEVTLDNLADEVVRIRQRSGAPLDTNEEARLRDAVRRIIDPENQVFLLLQRRLMEALKDRLAPELPLSPKRVERVVPNVLHTGHRRTKRSMKLVLEEYDVDDRPNPPQEEQPLIVKGFEDPTVVGYVTDLVKRLRECVDWVEWVWSEEMAIA